MEDEKFVRQNPLQTYLLGLVAHPTDLLWWLDYQWQTDQTAIQNSLQNFLDELWLATGLLHRFKGPTTAGCKAAFAALNQATGPGECLLQPYLKFKQELYHWAKLTKTPLGAINLPCSGSIQKYHWAKLTKTPLGGLKQLSQLFGRVLFATDQTAFEAGLAELESRPECKHPLLAARLASLKPKKAGLLAHFEDEHLALSSNALDRRFGRLERKVSSMPQFRPEQSAYWTITAWGIVQDLGYYGATARPAGQGRVEVAGVDLEGLSWLQFIMLKIARLHWLKDPLADAVAQT